MNSGKLIDFMTRLVADSKKKVFLIPPHLRVHHLKAVAAWLEDHKYQIECFFLLPYAPEYNPDELLNSNIKRNADARQSPRTQAERKAIFPTRLPVLTSSLDHVALFFHVSLTCHAA